jgi:hypothetical protein
MLCTGGAHQETIESTTAAAERPRQWTSSAGRWPLVSSVIIRFVSEGEEKSVARMVITGTLQFTRSRE